MIVLEAESAGACCLGSMLYSRKVMSVGGRVDQSAGGGGVDDLRC